MSGFPTLRVPILAAPMAGGPSTPALVSAMAEAGGLGFLAAGYLPVAALAEQVAAVRTAGTDLFGVNLFVPDTEPIDLPAVLAYREALLPLAAELGLDGLPEPYPDDDGWAAKVDLLVDQPVPIVSFTFGLPDRTTVERLHGVDTLLVATVTSTADARAAVEAGMDGLVVQGPGAGGHQGTWHTSDPAPSLPLDDLLAQVLAEVDVPVVAAGGLATADDVHRVVSAGAAGAQLGTAFLLTPEAGTNPTYRAALTHPGFGPTRMTRAFSGRWARSLDNAFIATYDALAPASYPAINQVTGPIRRAAAAAGDAQHLHLWAGTGVEHVREASAAEVVAQLWPDARE
ncbi:nitroalkane oxidase [Raineyella antarctica]|uniref:Propionate 3-nitronate monooxygenase n=1 Tax=Raineyella antarctica TaxID=1577474 RepID=A0A1G6GGB6_9ACTN|nr:nitronate monooxygenase [Raineyella antarctica]SDB80785.1 nitroalkane oxidase [Raineyella antarctica]